MRVVKCDRCGRDNEAHLRFCQDCGNRLVPLTAAVEATPPRGVATSPGAESAVNPSRPPAPDFDFSPRKPRAPAVECPRCTSANAADAQFCAACGAPLAHSAPAGAAAPEPPPPPALAASPIVHVAPPIAAGAARVTCGRCRGDNSSDMSYCQFCGARLASGTPEQPLPPAAAPAPLPPMPPPPPPPPAAPPPAPLEATPGMTPGDRAGALADAPPTFARGVGVTTHRYAPPAETTAPARLVVIAQDGSPGRHYELADSQTDVGREEGAILLPNDPFVSPRHARVARRNGRFFVSDLGSVNGVFVRLREPQQLEHTDLVLIGLEVLRFETVSDAERGLGPALERGTQLFGSPAARRHARLCERTVEGTTRDIYYLTRDETVIGREAGDIVFTADPFMSRRHAAFVRAAKDGSFTVRDLGSSNGTYLAIRGEHEVRNGDHLRIGQHLFRLDVVGDGAAVI